VINIPILFKGSNNYVSRQSLQSGSILKLRLGNTQGFYLKLLNKLNIITCLARDNINMPNYNGFLIHVQVLKAKFEVVVYKLLRSEPNILASCLLYYHILVQHISPRLKLL
jgi:hypothetical protein